MTMQHWDFQVKSTLLSESGNDFKVLFKLIYTLTEQEEMS